MANFLENTKYIIYLILSFSVSQIEAIKALQAKSAGTMYITSVLSGQSNVLITPRPNPIISWLKPWIVSTHPVTGSLYVADAKIVLEI